jgi:hypothetical protein
MLIWMFLFAVVLDFDDVRRVLTGKCHESTAFSGTTTRRHTAIIFLFILIIVHLDNVRLMLLRESHDPLSL